jgi:uncharacterized membrane protein YgaE (UPF0421/DUF939 family)
MTLSAFTPSLQLSLRAALAAGLAIAVADALKLEYPLYALVAAVLVTDLSSVKTRRQSLPRMAGTILGASLGAGVNPVLPHDAWAVAVGVFLAMSLTHLFRFPDAAKVAGYVCGIVVLDHGDHPWSYALYRTLETGLGIAAALLLSLFPLLIPLDKGNSPPS